MALATGLAAATPGPGAAEPEADGSESETGALGRLQVTATRLRRSESEGPTPVVTITREEFENQGHRTVQDVLDGLTQNTGGSLTQAFVFGFTPGASAVSLRGFGQGRTLTLMDGRRIPVYPLGIGGTTQFFDLTSIPTTLVERIEILTDGASAIYGSDAIGGVINIITRKDFDGASLSLRAGDTSQGGYATRRGELTAGFRGEAASFHLTAQRDRNDALFARDRSYAGSDLADPLGRGVYSRIGANIIEFDPDGDLTVTPDPLCGSPEGALRGQGIPPDTRGVPGFVGHGVCGFDRAPYRMLFPANDHETLSGHAAYALERGPRIFASGRWVEGETRLQFEPFPYQGTALFGGGAAAPTVPNRGGLTTGPNGLPAVYSRRLLEFGPRTSEIHTRSAGLTVGIEGALADTWRWEAGLGANKQTVRQRRPAIVISALEARIDDGLDLLQPIPESVVRETSYVAATDAHSQNRLADLQVSGYLPLALAGGPIGVAAIVEWEEQTFRDVRDPITARADGSDGGSAGGQGRRQRRAVAIETALPLAGNLELNLAGRWDQYDDASETGSAATGKAALQFRPLDSLLIRASYGTTFRAPGLQRLFGSVTRGYSQVRDTPRCLQAGGVPRVDLDQADPSDACDIVQGVRTLVGANVALREERGHSTNVGLVWDFYPDLSFSLDAYRIALDNIVEAPSAQFILDRCAGLTTGAPDPAFCARVERGAGGRLDGGLISAQALNLAMQQITGADVTARYLRRLDSDRHFNLRWETTYVHSLKTRFAMDQPIEEKVGASPIPRWRHNLTADWARGDDGATLRLQYIGKVAGANAAPRPGGTPAADHRVDEHWVVNATLRRGIPRWGRLRVGVNNLLNQDPPVDPTNPNWPWYIDAGGYYSPFGRAWFVEWSRTWD